MSRLSEYMFWAALLALGLATLCYLAYALWRRTAAVRMSTAGGPRQGLVATIVEVRPSPGIGRYATILAVNGLVFLTLSLGFRAIATGHGPFSNMYEFSVAFAWGAVAAHLYFERRYNLRALGLFVIPVAMAMLLYASTLPSAVQPLVPALQNNLLLTVHVTVAIVAYGTFTVSFGAALLYLVQAHAAQGWLPHKDVLDEIGYHSVIMGFPLMGLVIILGAVWADVAWGRYWGWDPKETASLVTWLLYGGYLHARTLRGWKGDRSALLLILGFGAVLLTYFGNLFFTGLHSYAGLK